MYFGYLHNLNLCQTHRIHVCYIDNLKCRYNIPWNPLGRKDVLWMPMVSQQPFAIFIWNEAWELCCCSFMESGGQIWRTLGKRILYGLFIYQHVGSYVWFLCLAGIISSSLPRKFCWFSVDDPHGDLKWLEGKLYTIESQHSLPRLFCGSCTYHVSTTIGGLDFELNAPEHDGTFSPNALNSYTINGFLVGDRWEGSDGLKVSKRQPWWSLNMTPGISDDITTSKHRWVGTYDDTCGDR